MKYHPFYFLKKIIPVTVIVFCFNGCITNRGVYEVPPFVANKNQLKQSIMSSQQELTVSTVYSLSFSEDTPMTNVLDMCSRFKVFTVKFEKGKKYLFDLKSHGRVGEVKYVLIPRIFIFDAQGGFVHEGPEKYDMKVNDLLGNMNLHAVLTFSPETGG
jgi:hypothetical protein